MWKVKAMLVNWTRPVDEWKYDHGVHADWSVWEPETQHFRQKCKWEVYLRIGLSVDSRRPIFTCDDGKWRSINVDSEPKVVNRLYLANQRSMRESNIIHGKCGRGANWAMGYCGYGHEQIAENTLEALRREVERCDSYCGTVMIHSLSGGTGSGLASRLCELIRDEYPLAYILSAAIAPHTSGESPLQHYNALLALTWLQRFSDGIILFRNDEVLNRLMGVNMPKGGIPKPVSLADMNGYIADCLAGVFLPLKKSTSVGEKSSGICTGSEPWEMLRSVCPMPLYKFVHTTFTSRRKSSWEVTAGDVVNTMKRYEKWETSFVSLANLAIARGDKKCTFPQSLKEVEKKLKMGYNCVRWNPFPVDFWIGDENLIGPEDSSLTVCANTSSFARLAQHSLSEAKAMFMSRAYLHWYQRWGCEEASFLESFDTMETVIQAYTAASAELNS